ncbi:MAG: FAD-dependent monooxygenase [Myxococcaceae bacterium]|nr:FAD-dependent monooxygenase [Myxococcaceae bacterium]
MVEVVIVGAGPIGLFLALLLRRQGVSVTVIETREGPVFDPRAAVIWPRTAEVLAASGLKDAFDAVAGRLSGVELKVRGARRGALTLGRLDGPEPKPWIIEQHQTEALLRRALDVEVMGRHTLVSLEPHADRVVAHVTGRDGPTTVEGRWLIGCDGSRSAVRKQLGIAFEGRAHEGLECLQVNAACTWREPPREGYCRFDLTAGATLLSMPLPTGGHRFVSFRRVTNEPLTQPTLEDAEAQLSHVAHEPLKLKLVGPTWLTRARFQDRVAARLRQNRVLLCGDAAAVWAPIGGRGMNVGLLGAHNLAWKLAAVVRGEAPEALLDTYDTELRGVMTRIISMLPLNRMEYPSGALGVRLLDVALLTAMKQTKIPAPIERLLSLYDVAPGGGAWIPWRLPRAGERLPDAELADGRRVHDVVDAGRWTLLGVGCPASAGEGVSTREVPLHDRAGRAWVTRKPRLVLVRPDGIIESVTTSENRAQLRPVFRPALAAESRPR